MWTHFVWIAGAIAIALCQPVQAKSDPLPPGTKEAVKPLVETRPVPANFSAVFTCKHKDITKEKVSWQHNKAKVMDAMDDKNTQYDVKTEPGTSTLTIARVQVKDQGNVTCQVQSGAGTVEDTAAFNVSELSIKVNQQNVAGDTAYIPDGTINVTYSCAIRYAPKDAKLSWFDKETELTATTCKDKNCEIQNGAATADVKEATVLYAAIEDVLYDELQCRLVSTSSPDGIGDKALLSGVIKLIPYGKPKFTGTNVTIAENYIQVESGQPSRLVCTDSLGASHTSKLLLYLNNTKVVELVSGTDNEPLNVIYQFSPDRENHNALFECKSINRIHGEMKNSSAQLPLRVIYGPENASVILTAPSVFSPSETFEARCHAGKNNPMITFTWTVDPRRGWSSSVNHTDCSKNGPNSWTGETISFANILVTPTYADTQVNVTCVVTNPVSGVTVAATAVVNAKAQSAKSGKNIVAIVVGSVIAGILVVILVVVWVIYRKAGLRPNATMRANCFPLLEQPC
ncbi:uncharacterized protein LOC129594448 [Paramacrobiotus metropolitanus]|uniref:uncharacterized protein LOC129594448 n=1 Tax=Paramacrobiotus metropolitanus TaxID=2943436 RepID=UPI002445CC28|nr:uncharacterized protein LOC129594448 [Paramacrobiotus metropolitanus]